MLFRSVAIVGYTHSPQIAPWLSSSHMASVDGDEPAPAGWRAFRTIAVGARLPVGHMACPASAERGHKLQCSQCLACGPAGHAQGRRHVAIWMHDTAGQVAARKLSIYKVAQ